MNEVSGAQCCKHIAVKVSHALSNPINQTELTRVTRNCKISYKNVALQINNILQVKGIISCEITLRKLIKTHYRYYQY